MGKYRLLYSVQNVNIVIILVSHWLYRALYFLLINVDYRTLQAAGQWITKRCLTCQFFSGEFCVSVEFVLRSNCASNCPGSLRFCLGPLFLVKSHISMLSTDNLCSLQGKISSRPLQRQKSWPTRPGGNTICWFFSRYPRFFTIWSVNLPLTALC